MLGFILGELKVTLPLLMFVRTGSKREIRRVHLDVDKNFGYILEMC